MSIKLSVINCYCGITVLLNFWMLIQLVSMTYAYVAIMNRFYLMGKPGKFGA